MSVYTNFLLFKEKFFLNDKKLILIGLPDNSSYFLISKMLFSGREIFLSGEALSKSLFQEEVENYNFLCPNKDIILYKAEGFKQGETFLESYFQKPNQNNRLIVFTEKKLLFDFLFKAGFQKTLLVLNLFEEKIYEKTKRLYAYLQSFLSKEKIQCSSSTLQEFLSFCSNCSHKRILEKLNQLICFVGEKKIITVKDIHSVLIDKGKNDFWEIRDLILKRDRKSLLNLFMKNENGYKENSLSLIAFLRSQMLFGLSLINEQKSPFNKKSILFSNYGVASLKKSIVLLFEIEQNIKNNRLSYAVNLGMLFIRLTKKS